MIVDRTIPATTSTHEGGVITKTMMRAAVPAVAEVYVLTLLFAILSVQRWIGYLLEMLYRICVLIYVQNMTKLYSG